jgi:hypothetical protein
VTTLDLVGNSRDPAAAVQPPGEPTPTHPDRTVTALLPAAGAALILRLVAR